MEHMIQETSPAAGSDYQERLEQARGFEKNGQFVQAENLYKALVADYPEMFGGWWAYARSYMESQLALEPSQPYQEIELRSTMLTKALDLADNSQKLFVKLKIEEYQEAWNVKCEESRHRTREALKAFHDFESFVHHFHEAYEAVSEDGKYVYRLLQHGRRALYFEKISEGENGKKNIVKYAYNNWNESNYRLMRTYGDAEDFDLYIKDFDGRRVVLVYVFEEDKIQKHTLIELGIAGDK